MGLAVVTVPGSGIVGSVGDRQELENHVAKRGYRTIRFPDKKGEEIAVRTSARVADALEEMVKNADLYDGVKLTQIMEAVYKEGRKDGARDAVERLGAGLKAVQKAIAPARPGRPRKQ
jgi:hypothetical protein